MGVEFGQPVRQVTQQGGDPVRGHRPGPCEAERTVWNQQPRLSCPHGEERCPGRRVERGLALKAGLRAPEQVTRLARHPQRPHPVGAADPQHHPGDQRMDMEVLVGVHVIERQAGCAESLELRGDLGGELAARACLEGEVEAETLHVAPHQPLPVGEVGKRLGRQGRPRLDQDEMQPDPQRGDPARSFDGIGGTGRGDHQAGGGEDTVAMGLLDGLVDLAAEAEIVGGDDQSLQALPLSRVSRGQALSRVQSGALEAGKAGRVPGLSCLLNRAVARRYAAALRSRRKCQNSTPSRRRRFIMSGERTISFTIEAIFGARK